jgi:hypothetical protein
MKFEGSPIRGSNMSNKQQSRLNYSIRLQMRIRRDKTAALLMPVFLNYYPGALTGEIITQAAKDAVEAADILIAHLDETRKDLAPTEDQNAAQVPGV